MTVKTVDVIVVGSGIAGLMTAHLLADQLNVMIITKSEMKTSNSSMAQGGMAAAIGSQDDWRKHLEDTIEAGQHHHKIEHIEHLVKSGPAVVRTLQKLGVRFDQDNDGSLLLGMEGAHQQRRIVHANGDQTGKAFTSALMNVLKDRVTILEQTMVIKLLQANNRVIGVQTERECIYAKATVLATGGVGQLYSYTSNVPEATGDGIALAFRAGAKVVDMEFVQFHPTLLVKGNQTHGLISEAVRGEGAFLIDDKGKKLMDWHPLADLAPRDVVSRAILRERKNGRTIYLNCRNTKDFSRRFPGLYQRCIQAGIDLESMLLPVTPGAHFISGGIETDSAGRTALNGLYAVGEVACTGVHGANRLASNSLLEGLVFAEQVAAHISSLSFEQPLPHDKGKKVIEEMDVVLSLPSKAMIQKWMTAYVGIERDGFHLQNMKQWLEPFMKTALQVNHLESREKIERKNMVIVAWLITEAAIQRTESRGGHYRTDYPTKDDQEWLRVYVTLSRNDIDSVCQSTFIHV